MVRLQIQSPANYEISGFGSREWGVGSESKVVDILAKRIRAAEGSRSVRTDRLPVLREGR